MFNKSHTIWNEKYRPETLETYVGNPTVKETFAQYIKTNDASKILIVMIIINNSNNSK